MIYTCALDLFSDSDNALNNLVDVSHKDFLTDKDYGLYLLIEWIGSVVSVLFLVS